MIGMLHGGTALHATVLYLATALVLVALALATTRGAAFPIEVLTGALIEVGPTETSISGTKHPTSGHQTSGHYRPTHSATAAVEVPKGGCPGQMGRGNETVTSAIAGLRRHVTSLGHRTIVLV